VDDLLFCPVGLAGGLYSICSANFIELTPSCKRVLYLGGPLEVLWVCYPEELGEGEMVTRTLADCIALQG